MTSLYRKIDNHFKLNGLSYSRDQLKEVAYNLIKEGEAFEKEIGDFLLDWLDDNPALQVRTSGSTGKPKPITLQKKHMVNSALATGEFFGLQPGDSALLCLPATYIAGKMMLVRAMVLGLEIDYIAPSSYPLAGISKTYDFVAMVPLQLENSLDALGRIKILIVGGAPLSQKVRVQVQACLPARQEQVRLPTGQVRKAQVFETYGMTETITHVALKKVNVKPSDAVKQGGGTIETQNQKPHFKALPSVTLSIDDRGCLIIDAPKISAAPVVTNDVVELVSETGFRWLGRHDNVINSGGVKLYPEQVEAKLASAISSRFFVAGVPDEKLGQKLILVIEGDVEEEKLLRKIGALNTLGKFEIPKKILQVDQFQQTESGKIQRDKTLILAMG